MDASEPGQDDIHAGYSPEEGILSRAREWTDLFGWLRLVRVSRIAGSPTALGIVALTLAFWMLGSSLVGGPRIRGGVIDTADVGGLKSVLGSYLVATPSSLLDRASDANGIWKVLLFVVWSVFAWTPAILFLMRQGALLTAGRNLGDAKSVARLAVRRTPLGWLVATIPLACGIAIGLLVIVMGFASRIAMGVRWIEFIFAVEIAVIALAGGILLFGANFAVPLGWAALVNEQQPDALDSLSRGYEYLYRRPLQLAMYLTLAVIPLWIVSWMAMGIARSATHFSELMLPVLDASNAVIEMTSAVLLLFSTIVAITLMGGLIGGVYLLLRSDAGGQEVEDIWVPKPRPKQLLPELPSEES